MKKVKHSCPLIDSVRADCKRIEKLTDNPGILELLNLITSKGELIKQINIELRSNAK